MWSALFPSDSRAFVCSVLFLRDLLSVFVDIILFLLLLSWYFLRTKKECFLSFLINVDILLMIALIFWISRVVVAS